MRSSAISLFRSLRFRLIASVVAIEVIMLSILVYNNISIIQQTHTDRLRDTAASMLQQITSNVGSYMLAVDYASLESYLRNIIRYKELAYIVVQDRDQRTVIRLGDRLPADRTALPPLDKHPAGVDDGIYDVGSDINVAGMSMGSLQMGFSLSLMEDAIEKSRNRGITIAVIEILLTVLVTVLIGLGLTRRLALLADAAAEVEAGNYAVSVPVETDDEIGRTAQAFNRMVAEVDSRTGQLQRAEARSQSLLEENRKLVHASLVIQEQERKNLARELHDEMGQCLTAIQADAELIRDRAKGQDTRISTSAEAIMSVSSQVYDVVHSMMRRLHPSVLDNLGLVEALKEEINVWNARHPETRCRFEFSGELEQLPENTNIMLYRIVQESLTNVAKHAGASEVTISLHQQGNWLLLHIQDNGRGQDADAAARSGGGLGLIGMRERVETFDGLFELSSHPGDGFSIRISVPLQSFVQDARKE